MSLTFRLRLPNRLRSHLIFCCRIDYRRLHQHPWCPPAILLHAWCTMTVWSRIRLFFGSVQCSRPPVLPRLLLLSGSPLLLPDISCAQLEDQLEFSALDRRSRRFTAGAVLLHCPPMLRMQLRSRPGLPLLRFLHQSHLQKMSSRAQSLASRLGLFLRQFSAWVSRPRSLHHFLQIIAVLLLIRTGVQRWWMNTKGGAALLIGGANAPPKIYKNSD